MVERLLIHEAAKKADDVIDTSKENIPAEQKAKIAAEEQKIRTALVNFKLLPDYADIIKYFKADPDSEGYEPEAFLKLYARRFEDMRKDTSSQANVKLEWLGHDTLAKLGELKGNLGDAAAENERLNIAVQKDYERGLPSYDESPSHVSESLATIGERIGAAPNISKLASAELEYNGLMVHLRKAGNANKYINASVDFKTLSGGKALETVKTEIDRGLAKVALLAGTDPVGAKKALGTRYLAAMDAFHCAIDVMGRSLVPEDKSSQEVVETQALSEEEIQFVLNVLLHGSQNPSFLEELFDAENAYQHVTGTNYEQMNTAEKFLVTGVGQGVGNAGAFVGSLMLSPKETIQGLVDGVGALFKKETRDQLWAVLKEGVWERMPPLEKTLLLTQMITDMLTGGAIEGGIGALLSKTLSSTRLAGLTSRMSSVARKTGLLDNAAKLALAVTPMLKQFPKLARYGTTAKEIAKTMAIETKIVVARLRVLGSKVEGPARDTIESVANIATPVAQAVHRSGDITQYIPAYADKAALETDLRTAAADATALGFSAQELVTIRSALQTLEST